MTEKVSRILEEIKTLSTFEVKELKAQIFENDDDIELEGQKSVKKIIYNLLQEIGMPKNVLGYEYISKSIMYCIKNPKAKYEITTTLYPEIAKDYNVKSVAIEKGMSRAIERTFEIGNMEKLEEIFGNTISYIKGKVVNSEFIIGIIEYIDYQ